MNTLDKLVDGRLIRASERDEVARHTEGELLRAIQDVLGASRSGESGYELRAAELVQLERAAELGAPPGARGASREHYFEVRPSDTLEASVRGRFNLRIAAISRLRVVTAQRSYRRLINSDPADNAAVSVALQSADRDWYPAVPLFGEGIFIDAPNTGPSTMLRGPSLELWQKADSVHLERLSELTPADSANNESNPLYVWWHTLSHRLLRALALDSGYSSTALRERVYAADMGGALRGGVLIYTTQPGGDGTLGGLISSLAQFDRILDLALAGLDLCSNDPLCLEERFSAGRANGSACYACLFASETSCEVRNMSLDRHVLLDCLA